MNERIIIELATKANLGPACESQAIAIKKFAELIVRECAEVADNADATRQKWEGIGKYVREHFGVEE